MATHDGEQDPFDALLRRAAQVPPVRSAGTVLPTGTDLFGGRFRVLRKLGSGGMGVVYEALDRKRGGPVAIKTLSRAEARDIYRFKAEFRSLADVVHPNLVRLHELFADEERWLFSMERVRGLPFDEWVRPDGALNRARLRAGLRQLVTGVGAIHAAGVLHRDLKPSNILVTREGRVVILDFGLVADRVAGGAGQTVIDGLAAGTPAYMAPEQADGLEATAATDLYAVGVILFEALTGQLPFDGTVEAIVHDKRVREAPRASSLAPLADEDADLEALCAALLARVPEQRPSVDAVLERLGNLPASAPLRESPDAPVSLIGRASELELLRKAHGEATAGRASVVWVRGESGMGKTALVRAFLHELHADGSALVLAGRCRERESLPYKAVDPLVDALSRHLRQLPAVEAAALMPRNVFALARLFPALGRLRCVSEAPARRVDDGHELRTLAFDALAELLARIRDRRPLVLHVDDMQWADRDSVRLLAHVLRERAPLLLLLAHRSTDAAPSPALQELGESIASVGAAMRECALEPLSAQHAIDLARMVAGPARAVEAWVQDAAGNPMLILELAHLARRGQETGLQAAIEARLREQGDAARGVLQLLAVALRPLPAEVLRAATGDADVHSIASGLCAAHLAGGDGEGFACYHERVRERVLEALEPQRVQALHASLARAWAGHPGATAQVMCEHWLGAGERAEAGRHAVDAAAEAFHGLAFDRAVSFYRLALETLPAEDARELELQERIAQSLSLAGRWAEAGHAYLGAAGAQAVAARARDLEYQAAVHLLGSGRPAEGLPLLRRGLSIAGARWPRTRVGALCSAVVRVLWLRLRAPALLSTRGALAEPAAGGTAAAALGRHAPVDARSAALLAGAALVPLYDLLRGLHYMTAFATRGLTRGGGGARALAAGMAATLLAPLPGAAALSRRLATRAAELARDDVTADMGSAALGFSAVAALLDGRLTEARELGAEGSAQLARGARGLPYQSWGARIVECLSLVLMGKVGDAAQLFAATEHEALELGDELGFVAGSSVLRHLVGDDVAAAERLLEAKEAVLARVGDAGVVHAIVGYERVALALYCGRGGMLPGTEPMARLAGLLPFNPVGLRAGCAIQSLDDGAPPQRVRRTLRAARAQLARGRGAAAQAMASHLEAVLHRLDGRTDQTLEALARAAAGYERAEMGLHAALMRWCAGLLAKDSGEGAGAQQAAQAEAWVRAQGIADPHAWARLLSPGLLPQRSEGR